ncbi:MAG: hypothetical protein FWD66_02390 [Paludibacter sp.]|nr:hypothetical protein [Paludibacter sp.]
MNNDEKFNIHVTLNGWRAPTMTIPRTEEELYRIAERCFNTELPQMMQKYDIQINEALILLAYNAILHFAKATDKYEKLVEKLQSWGNDVDEILNKNNN